MDAFFEGLFTRTPSWFFIISAIIILIGLLFGTTWIVLGTRTLAKSLGKEDKLFDLQERVHTLSNENEYNKNISLKLQTVLNNSRLFINTINSNNIDEGAIYMNIQRIIESLAADVKTNGGEKHRCGFWMAFEDGGILRLIQGSSGFPDHYIGNRVLETDNSIAGRCYRKKILINCPDVNDDHDYEKSDNNYTSLICVPIDELGVLTIDGLNKFDENVESISELYASIIEVLLYELYIFHNHVNRDPGNEVASTIIETEDD